MNFCLLLLSPAARAGHYITSYACLDNYNSYGGTGANAGYGKFLSQNGSKPLTATLNAQITATFTWSPDYPGEATPPTAVVSEDSQVGWGYGSNDSGSGSSGLSGGQIVSGGSLSPCRPGQNSLIHFLQETKTWVKLNPGPSFDVSCTPTATDSLTYYYGTVGVSVGYLATATPVILSINLKGTTPDSSGNLDILVGQVCTASVVVTPAIITPSAYQWSDPGGTTLTSWTPGSAPVAAVWPSGVASPSWYWNDLNGAPRTVQCVVTVGGTQTTLTKTVTEQVPSITNCIVTPGSVYINGNCPNQGGALFIYAGGPGMGVNATFSTPALFGPGQMELVQTITPGDNYKTSDGKQHPDPNDGVTGGLDTSYPAGGSEQAEPTYANSDSPGIPLKSYMSSVALYLTFTDWLLYQPPDAGNGRYYVPRKTYGWNVASSLLVAQPAGGWADQGNTSYGSVTITPACTDTNQYPTWTQTLQGQSVPWPASP